VSFDLDAADLLLVLGPSGSGKSTLALAIAGLVPRELPGSWQGTLEVGGRNTLATPAPELAAAVGLVFQDPATQLVMDRVEDEVAFGLENRGWPLPEMRRRVPQALAELGVVHLARRRVTRLSGGQQQRVVLAGAIAPRPGVLVLDEPTANLDPAGARAFTSRLARLRQRRSATIVLIEHRVELVWDLADRLLVLGRDGRPIAYGSPESVVRDAGPALVRSGVWLPAEIERALTANEPSRRAAPPGRGAGAGADADSGLGGRGVEGRRAALAARGAPVAERDTDAEVGAPLVEAIDLAFGYEPRSPVLNHVRLKIAQGERVVLAGPNGSGKSTLGKLLVGLLRPERGRVALQGAAPHRLPASDLARRAGYVFQDPEQQFLAGTVKDEVMLGLRAEERRAVPGLMAGLDLPLEAFSERSPYSLSGGEQRRLSLACVLVRRPRLLVLDEPTFGQDRVGYEGLLTILGDRVDEGAGVVAASHDLRFLADFGDRVVGISDGSLVYDGRSDDLLHEPARLADLGLASTRPAAGPSPA
jgi:energy-coupling factor transporter ATP-binding protein EcfA2